MFRVQSPGGTPLGEFSQTGGERGIAYDTTGRWAVVASGDFQFSFGSIGVWDLTTGTSIVELSTGGLIESVAVSPDGSWVAEGYRFADGAEVDVAVRLLVDAYNLVTGADLDPAAFTQRCEPWAFGGRTCRRVRSRRSSSSIQRLRVLANEALPRRQDSAE